MKNVKYNLYWGDMHTQFKPQWRKGDWVEFLEQSFADAKEYLDFYPIVYYPAEYYNTKEGLKVESVGWRDKYQPEWETICALVKKHHKPGKFVTFPGYEWTGDRTRWGDHNVFYPDDDPPLDLSMTIDELYDNLRKRNGIAIPHHSGYAPGQRSKDWHHYDENISPFAEIFSGHGCSEGCNTPLKLDNNPSMGPRVTGDTIQDGLAKGCRVGIMASGDNGGGFAGKHGTGLMACYAKELTREAIWEAFLARRVYGVTGDRIQLALWANNHFMGDVFRSKGPVHIRADVTGTQAVDRIELIKNNRVVATHCHQGTWDIPKKGTIRVKIRLEHGWGPASNYGFRVSQKVWDAKLQAGKGAKIVSAEGCFARSGQKIEHRTGKECSYRLLTAARHRGASPMLQQSVIIEIEGKPNSTVKFTCNEISETFTLAQLTENSRLLTLRKQVVANMKKQFGLTPDQIENPEDVLFHNSHKIKLHQAIPEKGFTATLRFTDDKPKRGRNFYYIRVSQLNGQYAWSSPIWVDNV